MPAVLFTGDSIDENQGDNSEENPDRWVLSAIYLGIAITILKSFFACMAISDFLKILEIRSN